jgi:two-component system, response regulator FlrC
VRGSILLSETPASGDRPGVLVVDDDEGIRENIVDLLRSEDYRVVSASNADEAMVLLESEKIDLLLTDFQMPGKNGVELIEAARKRQASLPAILMTAYLYVYEQLDEERRHGIKLLRKPFDADEVLRLVANEVKGTRPLEN